MPLIFQLNEGLGFFAPEEPEVADKQLAQLNELLGPAEEENPNPKKIVRSLKSMISKDPLFLRGYALSGQILHDLGDEEQATEMFNRGYRAGLQLIPEDYEGPLNAENPEVQFFLRCHTGYVESLLEKHEYSAALAACRRQLVFDPEDMFARRLELGEICIMAGELEEAEAILLSQTEDRGTAWYSLAYLSFIQKRLAEAATRLRRGFLRAPYAVDFLTGRYTAPNLFWERGPKAPVFNESLFYLNSLGGEMWAEEHEARSFMEWLSQTSVAMFERASMVELSEVCFDSGEPGPEEDQALDDLWQTVDDETSGELIQWVQDPETCEEIYPWQLLARHHDRVSDDAEDCGCGGHHHEQDEDC